MGELTLACPWTVEESSCLQGCDDRQGGAGALWLEGDVRGTQCSQGEPFWSGFPSSQASPDFRRAESQAPCPGSSQASVEGPLSSLFILLLMLLKTLGFEASG